MKIMKTMKPISKGNGMRKYLGWTLPLTLLVAMGVSGMSEASCPVTIEGCTIKTNSDDYNKIMETWGSWNGVQEGYFAVSQALEAGKRYKVDSWDVPDWSTQVCNDYFDIPSDCSDGGGSGGGNLAFVEGPSIPSKTANSLTVEITLNEPAQLEVRYGTSPGNLTQVTNHEYSFNYAHHVQTLSGLSAGTTYYYQVYAWEEDDSNPGNPLPEPLVSAVLSDTTDGNLAFVAGPSVPSKTTNSLTVETTLNEPAQLEVRYGTSPSNLNQVTGREYSFNYAHHVQTLSGLSTGTTYYYQVYAWEEDDSNPGNPLPAPLVSAVLSDTTNGGGGGSGGGDSGGGDSGGNYSYPPSQTQAPSSTLQGLSVPSVGQSIPGDVSGTTIRAVSSAYNIHAYSRRMAWNSDETVLYIGAKAYNASNLNQIRDIQTLMSGEFYPSHTDPDVVYGTSGSEVRKGTISNGNTEVLVTIPGESLQLGRWEGGISIDDQYAVVNSVDRRRLWVVNLQLGTVVSGPYTLPGNMDNADISQNGEFVTWTIEAGNYYYANRNFTNVVNTGQGTHHSDLCVDQAGDQVIAMFSGNTTITFVRMRDNYQHVKTVFPTSNGHLSCTSFKRPGWVYASTSRVPTRAMAVKIDYEGATTYEDWGFTRSFYNQYYYDQAKLTASPSGTSVMYTSEWRDGNGNNPATARRDFILTYDQ